MLDITPRIALRVGGDSLDLSELARLLAALEAAPRVSAAARALGMSYRSAWGKVVRAERLLGVALVERVKGHGSQPTAAGAALARAGARFEREAARRLATPAESIAEVLDSLRDAARGTLGLAASHDLLLQEALSAGEASGLNVRFVGSELALAALERGESDLAGFHLPEPLAPPRARPAPFHDARLFVEPVMRREQGLIVARGNPLRVRDVADLARTGLRFVNRQRGAGTRAWLDRLIAERGLRPGQIHGYEQEEFTHFAVAAAVAAGAADAGFGLRAAALQFGLDFVPVGTEVYYLAGQRPHAASAAVKGLVRALRARARETPGYGPITPRAKRRP
jgi:molybdate transport repressor ModE-like protein